MTFGLQAANANQQPAETGRSRYKAHQHPAAIANHHNDARPTIKLCSMTGHVDIAWIAILVSASDLATSVRTSCQILKNHTESEAQLKIRSAVR